jgi:hypothetical protein
VHILKTHRKFSNKQPNATTQTLRKTRTIKSQNRQKKRNNKNKAEINKIETKKTI